MYKKSNKVNIKNGDNMDFSELGTVTLRALSSLATLFIVTKIIGKRQLSELSLFDYVIGISIGNFAAEMTINTQSNEINGIFAVILFGICSLLIETLTMKSIKLRSFFYGDPTVIIQKGKLIEKNMKKNKLDVNDLLEHLRINGYFDINEVEYAIMEANGKMSVLPKDQYSPLKKKDMNVGIEPSDLIATVIIDGQILDKNLKKMNKTTEWLNNKLMSMKYVGTEKILLATLDSKDKLNIYEKGNNTSKDVL